MSQSTTAVLEQHPVAGFSKTGSTFTSLPQEHTPVVSKSHTPAVNGEYTSANSKEHIEAAPQGSIQAAPQQSIPAATQEQIPTVHQDQVPVEPQNDIPAGRDWEALLPDTGSLMDNLYLRGENRWSEHKEKAILGPYNYISSEPGKEFRTQLLGAFNCWLNVSTESLNTIAIVIRMLHNASLLIDDIQDNSTLRRGRPVAHKVFGVAQTINSGNFVYFLAQEELKKLKNSSAAIDIFVSEMLALHRGQGMDLFWRDTLNCPSEDDYLEMISNKTGGLFRLAVKLMQAESDRDVDCMPFVNLLGLIFQITDDYKNLSSTDYTAKKGYCEDLTEGKFSFPVIHSIHAEPSNQELIHILAQKPTEIEIKQHAVRYMESTGSFAYTRRAVHALMVKAMAVAIEIDTKCGISSSHNSVMCSLVEKVARI